MGKIAIMAAAAFLITASASSAGAAAKDRCGSVQARCAVEAGGSCDPQTGKWIYRCNRAEICQARFNDCVAKARR